MDEMTVEQRLRALEEREPARRAVLEYCDAIDQLDAKRAAAVYAADAVDDHIGNLLEGRGAVERFFSTGIKSIEGGAHMITNHRLDVDGDVATSTAYVLALFWDRHDSEGENKSADTGSPVAFGRDTLQRPADRIFIGRYDDSLKKIGGHWRIFRRTLSVSTVVGAGARLIPESLSS